MDFKIVWTEPAIDELGELVRHVAKENPSAARSLGEALLQRIEVAAAFPQIGPIFPRAATLDVRCLTHGNYRLYYRVKSSAACIEVVSVRHSARAQPSF